MYGYGAPVYGTGYGMGMGGIGMGMGGMTEVRTETIRQTPFGVTDTITDQFYPNGGYGTGMGTGMGMGMGYGGMGMGGMAMGYGGTTTVDTIQRTPFGTVETIRSVPNYGPGGFNNFGGGFY